MQPDPSNRRRSRARAAAAIACAGLVGVGCSNNGTNPFDNDCPRDTDCTTPSPPSPIVAPEYVTTQAGVPVTFTASDPGGGAVPITYQWSRSSDGVHYVVIPGATSATLTLPTPATSDDGASFRAVATQNGRTGEATSHLAVSSSPGQVFQDTEFAPADWVATPLVDGSLPAPTEVDQAVATGGFPGAWRSMVIQFAPTATRGTVVHASVPSTWDPSTQGTILAIDYAEDGIAAKSTTYDFTSSAMLLEQAGRRYVSDTRYSYERVSVAWTASQATASLRASDFHLIDGPACGTGESCPDFSSTGGVMRFGYWRMSASMTATSVANGIDNWKVTVWKP